MRCVHFVLLLQGAHGSLCLYASSYVIVDTPGQIEIFTWSASGAIITDAVASALPTVIAYIVDTPRTVAPATFMSNMLYACRYVAAVILAFLVPFATAAIRATADMWLISPSVTLYPLALF